ncbi:MAG: polysaccharide biosynthesis/export family protein [Opitutales bacterium]
MRFKAIVPVLCLILPVLSGFAQDDTAAAFADVEVSGNYVLRPSDRLEFSVFQEPDMAQEIQIQQDGSINLPLIGRIEVGGMTLADAREAIYDLYNRDYLVNPQIRLRVIEFAPQWVKVLGQVNSPGNIPIPPDRDLTLLEAVGGAKGFTRIANMRTVKLKRTTEDGEVITMTIDVEEILNNEKIKDIPVKDGDSIFVEERRF